MDTAACYAENCMAFVCRCYGKRAAPAAVTGIDLNCVIHYISPLSRFISAQHIQIDTLCQKSSDQDHDKTYDEVSDRKTARVIACLL